MIIMSLSARRMVETGTISAIFFSSASRLSSASRMSRLARVPLMISSLLDLNWASSSLSSLTLVVICASMSARKDWIASVPSLNRPTSWRAASTAFSASVRFDGVAE